MGRFLRVLSLVLSATVSRADGPSLEPFQATITRAEFDSLLTNIYCPSGALGDYLAETTNALTIYSAPDRTNALFTLRFAGTDPVTNRPPIVLRRIVLDPGHIGGEWARMEERFFVRGQDRPVQEAVLNLTVARLIQEQLRQAGCEVWLSKNDLQPVTQKRPEDFRGQAEQEISQSKTFDEYPPLERDAARADAIRKRQEQLFYRSAEIAARAGLINEKYQPDLTICVHFNAVQWNEHNDLVEDNRLVVFVHGDYLPREIVDDEQRMRLFYKLLERADAIELPVAESIANALAAATKLTPVQYGGPSAWAKRVGTNEFVFARNLAANRLINGPVVYLEPYYMNNRIVYQRLQLGDYDGEKMIGSQSYRSIFREYADAVVAGLRPYLPAQPPSP